MQQEIKLNADCHDCIDWSGLNHYNHNNPNNQRSNYRGGKKAVLFN